MNRIPLGASLVGGIVLLAAIVFFMTRPSFGSISQTGYELAVALESTCSRRDTDRLKMIRELLADQREMNEQERGYLDRILCHAESGSWDEARKMTRDLMLAQVDR